MRRKRCTRGHTRVVLFAWTSREGTLPRHSASSSGVTSSSGACGSRSFRGRWLLHHGVRGGVEQSRAPRSVPRPEERRAHVHGEPTGSSSGRGVVLGYRRHRGDLWRRVALTSSQGHHSADRTWIPNWIPNSRMGKVGKVGIRSGSKEQQEAAAQAAQATSSGQQAAQAASSRQQVAGSR